jgi:hypothetical protein
VCSPLLFENQHSFEGLDDADSGILLNLITGPSRNEKSKCVLTLGSSSTMATIFNQGTIIVAAPRSALGDDERFQSPACALANVKNALLMTTLMVRFYKYAAGTSNAVVAQMRREIVTTFETLVSKYGAAHAQVIWENHESFKRMKNNDGGNVSNFNFYAPVRDSAIGPNATLIQNLDVGKLISALAATRAAMEQRATTDDQKADLESMNNALTEAQRGNKSGAVEFLKRLGSWGLDVLKEFSSAVTAELLAKLMVP